MVPPKRSVGAARPRRRESDLAPIVRAHLEAKGYRVWVDPDKRSYFDVVARRGAEIGLVELKLSDWRKVFAQALRRRGYGDWLAVAVPNERLARRILELPTPEIGDRVGVWVVDGEKVAEIRAARRVRSSHEQNPFPEHRAGLSRLLDLLESGILPESLAWPGPPGLAPGKRSTREYRLEEFPEEELDPFSE